MKCLAFNARLAALATITTSGINGENARTATWRYACNR
jgi:hypothetical protein